MNDLPQYELLSAYLDGELTTAEQAEVERLLATDPSARQLFDELHALSVTLQALPQQKLGEDLSQKVLRIAERRMLTEGEPGQPELSPDAPVPLTRSVFQRFFNRRTMVWTGIAVALAVVITVHDWQQQANRAGKGDREVALAKVKIDKEPENAKLGESREERIAIPSIQAAHDMPSNSSLDERSGSSEKFKKSAPASSPAAEKSAEKPMSEMAEKKPADKSGDFNSEIGFLTKPAEKKPANSFSDQEEAPREMESATPNFTAKSPAPSEALPPAKSFGGIGGGMGKGGMGKDEGLAKGPGTPKGRIGKSNDSALGDAFGMNKGTVDGDGAVNDWINRSAGKDGDKRAVAKQADGKAAREENVLVVHCAISPDAAKNKAFDKLLDANGIKQLQQLDRKKLSTVQVGQDFDAKNTAQKEIEISVEATPAQIEATLAGLAAQPEVFLSVSVESSENNSQRESSYGQAAAGDRGFSNTNGVYFSKNYSSKAAGPAPSKSAKNEGKRQTESKRQNGFESEKVQESPAEPRQQVAEAQNADQSIEKKNAEKGAAEPRQQAAETETTVPSKDKTKAEQAPQMTLPPSAKAKGNEKSQEELKGKEAPAESLPPLDEPNRDENSGTDYGGAMGRSASRFWSQQPQQAAKQRVLFVLHVAGNDRPPVASSRIRAQETPDAAKAPEPAEMPAAQPAPSKQSAPPQTQSP